MSKWISRREFLKGATAAAVSAGMFGLAGRDIKAFAADAVLKEGELTSEQIVALNEAIGEVLYTPGTYTATASGMGNVVLEATFSEKSITKIVLDVTGETEGIGRTAADELIAQVLTAQSAEIDGVSGATLTSNAVRSALNDAIAQAKGTAEVAAVEEAAGGPGGPGGPGGGPGGPGGPGGGPAAPVEPFVSSVTEDGRVKGYAGPGDWLGTAPTILPDEIVDTEIVVVGAGHSGTQAALSASQAGAKVVVLEAQSATIFDWYGEDIAAYNCDLAKEHGLKEYDLGEITLEYINRSGGRCNPDVIRLFVQNSGPMMNNMLAVANEVCADKERFAALPGIAGTVLENNVLTLDPVMLTYDNTPDGQLFIQTNIDAEKALSGADVYDCENLTNYPLTPGTKTWASTVTFAGPYNWEPIQGVAANSTLRYVESACLAKAVELGAQIVFGSPAQVLVQDAEGSVTGVIAKQGDKYVQYNASKGVILAGGDYAGNKDMCWALLTEYMEENERLGGDKESFFSFMGGRDGSSVKLGCWAGGFVDPAPRGTMILGGGPSSPWGANSCLWLNAKGKRFTNEGHISSANRATFLQQNGTAVMLVDGNWLKSVAGSGMEHGGPDFGRPQFLADVIEGMNSEPDENGQISILTGTIMERGYTSMYKANTLEELLKLCGYEDEVIATALKSIERYNELCHKGVDSDYGKGACALQPIETAPFFASVTTLSQRAPTPMMVTMTGLMTDENLNVMRNDNSLIKGLYAVGNSLGGRYGLGYSCPSAGNSIGMATTHGWLAGQIVAAL